MRLSLFASPILCALRLASFITGLPSAPLELKPSLVDGPPLSNDTLVKRAGQKYVFMHHIVGNTHDYTQADWEEDIRQIQAKGVDAIALNLGSADWQRTQIRSAYAAAKNIGATAKLFLSFDFTEMPTDIADVVSRVNEWSGHSHQFTMDGKKFVSSFSGDAFGNSGWQQIKTQTNGYLMPFVWGQEGKFDQWTSLDSWLCWGCAWPQSNEPKDTDDDLYYISQLGTRYAATMSPWFYTHYDYKNRYLRSDEWLAINRWEQLINQLRNTVSFVEMATWNDWGESSYFGPRKSHSLQPSGTTWADGFPHTEWFELSAYFIQWFKTGVKPAITKDKIYFWARPHLRAATPYGDSLPRPDGWDWSSDTMWAVVFSTAAQGRVTLRSGTTSLTVDVGAGYTKLSVPLQVGTVSVGMTRNGQTVIPTYTPSDFSVASSFQYYNYNAYVGAASA